MSDHVETAMTTDISGAVVAVTDVAVSEVSRQAEALVGKRAVPGSVEWDALTGPAAEADLELATQLLHLRIELAVGIDPIGTVIGLRRWGATWAMIARASGSSRQASFERWGVRVREVLDRYRTGELGGPVAQDERDLTATSS